MANILFGVGAVLFVLLGILLYRNRDCLYIGDHFHSEGDK